MTAESAEDDASSESDREVIMNEAQHILADYIGMEEKAPAVEFSIGRDRRARTCGVRY